MTRRDRQRCHSFARSGLSGAQSRTATQLKALPAKLPRADRKSLLLGTALASTLLIAMMAAPTPAHAVVTCVGDIGPISHPNVDDVIDCVNTEPRTNAGEAAIYLSTDTSAGNTITLDTSGTLTASHPLGDASGIRTWTETVDSFIDITSSGDIEVAGGSGGSSGGGAYGIRALTSGGSSPITITSSGNIEVAAGSGATFGGSSYGIRATTEADDSSITITNSGSVQATGGDGAGTAGGAAQGIRGTTDHDNSTITITNSASVQATGGDGVAAGGAAQGIRGRTDGDGSTITIANNASVQATGGTGYFGGDAYGIFAEAFSPNSRIEITNSGDITATGGAGGYFGGAAHGIHARSYGANSPVNITNSGNITAESTGKDGQAVGIRAYVAGTGGGMSIANSGRIDVSGAYQGIGIYAVTVGDNNSVSITNGGDITANATAAPDFGVAVGITVRTNDANGSIAIDNSARIDIAAVSAAIGIQANAIGDNSAISITNSGDIHARSSGDFGSAGIYALSVGGNSPITIENSGSVYASGKYSTGIHADSDDSNNRTTIVNTGEIGAESGLAINVDGAGTAHVYNAGTITGYVSLTDQNDLFVNQAGGVFEARQQSNFYGGSDLFRNQAGGTVHALSDGGEAPSFAYLERFENQGLISTVDGATGDHFTISNTPGGKDLNFVASGNSRLAVDAFLGGAGSATDTLTIEGNVSGTTAVTINNVNGGAGVFNPTGIKVVTVTGTTPNADAFYLDQPVDTGFFDYDLFFTPTGSGFWSLKSFAGAGAFLLPQLVTAAQDIWHQSSSTWFDRTTDLRVLLNGGGAAAYDAGGKSLGVAPSDGIAPAVWVRGSGSWLNRDDSASTSAYGRNYQFDLDRDLETIDFQVGLDMGTRDVLSAGDALVFGLLGGFIHADLDYDSITRNFDYDGGQVGAYATYMKGGLFVDTLLNVHLYELDANNVGFPSELDATTVGLRTDTGYRFGSFSGGAFLEPLATIEITWADIDGFSVGGNTVSFDDDANVRGRLGLRAGTTTEAWEGTMMEPFITGSLWGNLSGDNQATLVSSGSTFRFEDELDDVWGEVSAGVNFFNFSQTTAVFAKVDVTFGEDVSGVGGKAGMRVSW